MKFDEKLLNLIQDGCIFKRTVSIYGLNRVGKTSLANELAHRLKDRKTVLWFDVKTEEKFDEMLDDLLKILDAYVEKFDDRMEKIDSIKDKIID